MMDTTARLGLPLIAAGQAQKEMTHNEALVLLDLLVPGSVVATGMNMPPGAPGLGESWIVGDAPIDAWTAHAGAIAGWTSGGWRFAAPQDGMAFWVVGAGGLARRIDGEWTLTVPQPAVTEPSGGAVVDAEARGAIAAVLEILLHHRLVVAP